MTATLEAKRASGLRLAGGILVLFATLHMYEQWKHKAPRHRVIIIYLKGRLGNQLFQVAAGEQFRKTASKHGNASVMFKLNNYSSETDLSKSVLQPLPHIINMDEACAYVPEHEKTTISEVRHSCDVLELKRFRTCTLVDGFFQCPVYAEAGRQKILNLLQAMPEYEEAVSKYSSLVEGLSSRPTVALHVRRGDYTKRFNRGFLEPLPVDYYVAAKKIMPPGSVFLVFSDDVEWCRQELPKSLEVSEDSLVFVTEPNNIIALVLMMLCDHNIIANSTFSWWAAFLNEGRTKRVCAPLHWFGEKVKKDNLIYPTTWHKL